MTWKYTKQELDEILDALPKLEKKVDRAYDKYHKLCKKRGKMKARLEKICKHDEGTYMESQGHEDTLGNWAGVSVHTHCNVCKKRLGSERSGAGYG